MTHSHRKSIHLTTSLLALAAGTFSSASFAQDGNVLTDEIVVTATKKADGENVQDTNIAITAFGEEQLDAFQVRSISDLSFKIPNVQLDEIGTTKGTANFSIRGLGVNSSIPSIDPSVGVFVDGVYLGINAGVVLDTFDLDSVETLRGPQGVLFGRNVTGGAVVINTGNPTDEFTFKGKAAVESGFRGTGENYFLQGVVSGPIGAGFKAKLGGYYNNDEGWFRNQFDGTNFIPNPEDGVTFGENETVIVRGALEYDGIEGLNVLAKLEYGDTNGQGAAGQSHVNGSGVASFATNILNDPRLTFDRDTFEFAINELGFTRNEWVSGSLRTDLDVAFGNGTITNIFGYRDYSQDSRSDIDASILTVFNANFNVRQDQISNELRYNGRFFDDRLDFTAGFFYFNQTLEYAEQRDVGGAPLMFDGGGIQDHETFGLFASGEYQLTDRLSFNAGLRYSDETKEADIAQIELANAPCIIFEGDPRSTDFCPLVTFPTFETNNFSPKVGLGYEVQDNLRVYGHWARAFRAGGFNLRNTATDVNDPIQSPGPFEDERIDSFEIGFKSEPIAGARINGAVFFNKIDNLQRELNVAGGTAVVQQIITNAADAEIYGFELDALWSITDNFVINGSVGITEGQFTEVLINLTAPTDGSFDVAPDDGDLALEIPRLSPFTANLGMTYFQKTGLGTMTLNANYAHRDRAFFTDNNLGFINPQDRFDASVGLDIQDSGLNVTIYGKNLSNEVLHGGDTQLSNGTFSPLAKGRVIGLELNYEY